MTTTKRKKLLYVVNAFLALTVAAAVAYAVLPLAQPEPVEPTPALADGQANDALLGAPPLSAYEVIYKRDLRQPLQDRPVIPEAGPVQPPPPSLRLVLIGTVVEPRNEFAIFSLPGGATKTVAVGEKVDGAELVAVTTKTATLRHQGKPVTLSIRKEVKS